VAVVSPRGGEEILDTATIRESGAHDFFIETAELEGKVLDPAGHPVPGAVVQVAALLSERVIGRAMTDAEGQFYFQALVAQEVQVSAQKQDEVAVERLSLAKSSSHSVELRLPGFGGLRLRLVDGRAGADVFAPANFLLLGARGEILPVRQSIPEEDGIYSLPRLPQGPFTIVVQAPGYAIETLYDVRASAAVKTVELEAEYRTLTYEVLPRMGSVCTIELRRGLKPVALSVLYPPGPFPVSETGGRISLLKSGLYTVVLRSCDGKVSEKRVRLEVGSTPHLVFP
jgi:hypothetical protein